MLTHLFRKRKMLSIPELSFMIDTTMSGYSSSGYFKRKAAMAKADVVNDGLPDIRSFYGRVLDDMYKCRRQSRRRNGDGGNAFVVNNDLPDLPSVYGGRLNSMQECRRQPDKRNGDGKATFASA